MDVDGWIERALSRVEGLEAERVHCASSGDPRAALRTIEIDAEIEALVEALEAAAEDAESRAEVDAGDTAAGAPMVPWGGPQPGSTTIADALPPTEDTAPMRIAADPILDDEPLELPRRRYVWPAVAAVVGVLVLGIGAAVASGGVTTTGPASSSTPAASISAAATAPVEIVAAEIPPDAQEPEAARGADVDSTPPTTIPEATPEPAPKQHVATSPGRAKKKKHARRKKARRGKRKGKPERDVAFGRSRDPLSGLK